MKYFWILLFVPLFSCEKPNPDYQKDAAQTEIIHRTVKQLSDVIVHDIFSPPVASRVYAYPSIAAYEVMALSDDKAKSLANQLTDFTSVPAPPTDQELCYPLASTIAYLRVSKSLIFTEQRIEDFEEEILKEFREVNMPVKVFDASITYGNRVAQHILAWADKDKYKETRTFPKYSIIDSEAQRWKPTPPTYMSGIEPHWKEIRPFVLQSANQFVPPPPTEFSLEKESQFYKELIEVYEALEADNKSERIEIASFWDCNPYVMNQTGHVMFATKKITPGGHWQGITAIAAKKANADFLLTAKTYAMVSIALADAFISCWDEKYRSNLIRPETVINEHLDEDWKPALQTPPFPEYTSGHSVISTAAALVLTHIYGDNFSFDDDVEVEYGLPVRSFKSFTQASEEAAISRLYGGIHYRPAIDNGVSQGKKVGEYIIQNLEL